LLAESVILPVNEFCAKAITLDSIIIENR